MVQFEIYEEATLEIGFTVVGCWFTFYIAEKNEMSGVLACVFLGLTVSYFRSMISPSVEKQMENVWVKFGVF